MTSVAGKPNLFFITSPRSPFKMKDEVKVLVENFSHQCWTSNTKLQEEYYRKLAEKFFFLGSLNGDLALKARDRITRGPKALGLVDLSPEILLTPAGDSYLNSRFPNEAFTRQLLKFQFPSPFHKDKSEFFYIKPYLELFRLIYELDGLSKDEIAAFVMQLIHIDKYEEIKQKILSFRENVKLLDRKRTNYDRFFDTVFTKEIIETYSDQLSHGATRTRESVDNSQKKFLRTKKSNHLDYADAAIRYLRETKLFSLKSHWSTRIHVENSKIEEVKFILANVPRNPVFIENEVEYKKYLFNRDIPALLTDNKELLVAQLISEFPHFTQGNLEKLSVYDLKLLKYQKSEERLLAIIHEQEKILQTYGSYGDIVETYNSIQSRTIFDPSLNMEWNTWRAFEMLDDGTIIGNFLFDDSGNPLSNAPGNKSDILCQYTDFELAVEVTLSSGATQYMMEGEPVARHLGNIQKASKKECFSIFIAPVLNDATLSHFFILHRTPIEYYGGIARIIPLQLSEFRKMVEIANLKKNKPKAFDIGKFVKSASGLALSSKNEREWYLGIKNLVDNWV